MTTKQERKERIRQLVAGWLLRSLEVLKEGLPKNVLWIVMGDAFLKYCRENGIDTPQDKTLRNTIVRNVRIQLELISKEIKRKKEENSTEVKC